MATTKTRAPTGPDEDVTTRRRLLTLLGAGGVALVGTQAVRQDAAAADGDPLILGSGNTAGTATHLDGAVADAVIEVNNLSGAGSAVGIRLRNSGGGATLSAHALGSGGAVEGVCSTSGQGGAGVGVGVYGRSGTGIGVQGDCVDGTGVDGHSQTATGVHGRSESGLAGHFETGSGRALNVSGGQSLFEADLADNNSVGIHNVHEGGPGFATALYCTARADSPTMRGDNFSPNGNGVLGVSSLSQTSEDHGKGAGVGVRGLSGTGAGVEGECASGRAVVGLSESGEGVFGSSDSGPGVTGISSTGIAGYFQNHAGRGVLGMAPGDAAAIQAWSADLNTGTDGGLALDVIGKARFATAGSATVPAGTNSVFVANPAVTGSSHISVTPVADPGPRSVGWVARNPGSGFTLHLTSAKGNQRPATPFTYLIVEPGAMADPQ